MPLSQRQLWALGVDDVACITPIEGNRGLCTVKQIVSCIEGVSQGLYRRFWMKNFPRLDTCHALTRLEHEEERVKARDRLR